MCWVLVGVHYIRHVSRYGVWCKFLAYSFSILQFKQIGYGVSHIAEPFCRLHYHVESCKSRPLTFVS